jgi:hypothetical protein
MTAALQHMLKIIELYNLYVIPLCSIDTDGMCTCGKPDCSSPGKHPHFRFNWKVAASNDADKILQWTQKYTNLNWGVLTGRRSPVTNKFLTVVDIDRRDHAIVKTLPDTFSYSTGQGQHYWYWSDRPVKNSAGLVSDHVDIRGTNGYVVIPPSKHRSGSRYHFKRALNYNIATLPDRFNNSASNTCSTISKGSNSSYKRSSKLNVKTPIWKVRKSITKGDPIRSGMRNTTIHRLLSSDRAKGADEPELIKNAGYYKTMCEESSSITNSEVARIVYSVLKYPANKNLANPIELNEETTKFFKTNLMKSELFALPIREVRQAMQMHLIKAGQSNTTYITDQWLAGQLENCGFRKKRTSQGNRWLLRLI